MLEFDNTQDLIPCFITKVLLWNWRKIDRNVKEIRIYNQFQQDGCYYILIAGYRRKHRRLKLIEIYIGI